MYLHPPIHEFHPSIHLHPLIHAPKPTHPFMHLQAAIHAPTHPCTYFHPPTYTHPSMHLLTPITIHAPTSTHPPTPIHPCTYTHPCTSPTHPCTTTHPSCTYTHVIQEELQHAIVQFDPQREPGVSHRLVGRRHRLKCGDKQLPHPLQALRYGSAGVIGADLKSTGITAIEGKSHYKHRFYLYSLNIKASNCDLSLIHI